MDLMGCDKVMNGDTLGMLLVVEAFLFSFLCVCVCVILFPSRWQITDL